jgi:hypothetical protein
MSRRLLLAALLAASALEACAPKPPDFNYTGSYEPIYYAMTTAQQNLSSLAQYRGKPAQAARALAQYEFIIQELSDEVVTVSFPPASQPLIAQGHQEILDVLGIAPFTPPRSISIGLRRFANATQNGNPAGAQAALAQPFFTRGPQATAATLGNLPPMPAVESASYAFTRGAATMGNFSAGP